MKKTILFTILSVLISTAISAQNWIDNLPKDKIDNHQTLTFYEIQKAFNDYWEPFHIKGGYYIDESGNRVKATGWKQFRRWEWFWENRVDPVTGEFPNKSAAEIRQQIYRERGVRNAGGNWQSMGPNSTSGGYAGIGRLNCIAFVEGDDARFYVGSPSGGLWKTTDGGMNWQVLTDNNDALGVSDAVVIAGTSSDNDTVYIATGDRDIGSLRAMGGDQLHDNNTIGVLKSVDGGTSWSATDLVWLPSDKKTVNRLLLHPADNNILYASGTDGIFKTIDGGVTWPAIFTTTEILDMEFKPGDPGTIYGSTRSGKIYVSTDMGSSWSKNLDVSGADRVELAVSSDEPTWVYAVVSDADTLKGIYKSEDSGASFTEIFTGSAGNKLLGYYCDGSINGGQGSYDLCIAADPNDAMTVFLGGVNTWKSSDGGTSWSPSNMWTSSSTYNSCGSPVVHADKHFLAYQTGSSTLFECNDGGLYRTDDGGSTWALRSGSGMVISQLYRIGVSQLSSNNVIAGLQDNGTKSMLSGTWADVIGGDGMECIIDYADEDTQYGEVYYGGMYRTTNGWTSSTSITSGLSGFAAWVTPYAIDPVTHTTLYVGRDTIWKSTNQGTSWSKLSDFSTGGKTFRSVAIAPSGPDTIYAATTTHLYATYNGGTLWSDITGSLPISFSNITYISVNSDFGDTLWVSFGEYNAYGVYQSNDAGVTWTDISSGLPSIPVMCVIQNKQNTSDIELYAGTDVGVYVKVGSADWMLYSEGLPNVVVTELEIYYNTDSPNLSRIRAATFGRGLWESELYAPSTSPPTSDFTADNTAPFIGQVVTFTDMSINDPDNWYWTFTPSTINFLNGTSATSQNPIVEFTASGTYDVALYTENENGDDTETKSGYITVSSSPTYCSAYSTNPYGYISRVEFVSIDNSSTYTNIGDPDPDDIYYEDWTSISTNVVVSSTNDLTVTNGTSDTDIDLAGWIDWNQDGDFDDSDEEIICDENGGGEGTFSVTIPSTAKLGSTRLRLRTKYFVSGCGESCGATANGEVEDYTVNVVAGSVTWEGNTSTDWATASNWSNGMVPNGSFNITIPSSPAGSVFPEIASSTLDAICNGLTIESGANLTIYGNLTTDSTLTNNAGNSGLVIGSTSAGTGSLITPTDNVDATVQRYIDGGMWHLIASSVDNETIGALFMNHDPEVWIKKFLEGSGSEGDWGPTISNINTPMPLGNGFATWLETGKTGTASFEGTITSSNVSPALSFTDASHGYNLVGNPFPCALDWDQGGWGRTDLDGSVWVYESGSGYLTRNSYGIGSLTNGIIPISQGFFVRAASGSASLTIPSLARIHSSQDYYKASDAVKIRELPPYLVLNVEEDDMTDEVWITFCDICSNSYENGWDSRKFFGEDYEPQLYLAEDDLDLSIDAVAPLTNEEREFNLDFDPAISGTHYLKLKETNELDGSEIMLEDLFNGSFHDLSLNPSYQFVANKNDDSERFVIHLITEATGYISVKKNENYSVYAFRDNIFIQYSGSQYPGIVQVVDLFGRQIYYDQLENKDINIITVNAGYKYLIVKIIDNGSVYVKKIFVQ